MASQREVRKATGWAFVSLLATAVLLVGCPVNPNPDPDPDPDPEPQVVVPVSTSPGLNVEIEKVEIPADLKPVIHLTITDNAGQLIPLRELTDARFILAYLNPSPPEGSTAHYISYNTRTEAAAGGGTVLQATYDGAGLGGLTQKADGTLSYKFGTALPADYIESATHQIGGQLSRRFPIDKVVYPANADFKFRPDGGMELGGREIVNTETCNVCHTRLAVHGTRREVQLCILCHNPGSTDGNTGNSVDFAEMIHKIHRGADLPSVQGGEPYQIVGFRNTVHDYSEVHFPQPVQNCTACHANTDMANIYMTTPTIAGCASCHDRTWFGDPLQTPAGWENHLAGQQVDNRLCALCHTPTAPGPSPIMEAHRLLTDHPNAPGLALTVNSVTTAETETGIAVTINFTAEDESGAPYTQLSALSTVAATVAYPAAEYETSFRETINAGNSVANGDGTFNYTFRRELPAGLTDTVAVAMDGRLNFAIGDLNVTQGTSSNGRMIFTANNSQPVERRQIVDDAKCNACHGEVRLHGSLRVGVEYCVMCHNPSSSDINRRPEGAGDPETINFKDMIHKIHRGAELESGYTVYGFGSNAFDFSGVHFPGDLRACEMCHVEGSYSVPLAMETLSTIVTDAAGALLREKLPERAACVSCHDSLITEVHAILQTDPNTRVESCSVCHGNNADFSVLDVHNMGP